MRIGAGSLLIASWLGIASGNAGIASFQHIVVIFQENRTPDNLFQGLCAVAQCSTKPDDQQYNIQTSNWLDKNSPTGTIDPAPEPLETDWDPSHRHADFVSMCDLSISVTNGRCKMDGAGDIKCSNDCPLNAEFTYVENARGILDPYITLATQYGWANYMFQTNQGPSFPAHQFLFGGTSAPSAAHDHKGVFVAENLKKKVHGVGVNSVNGCLAPKGSRIQLIDPDGVEDPANQIYPCFEHQTVPDILTGQTWRYYTPGAGDLWSAPDAIRHICEPVNHQCTGTLWNDNVDLVPSDVLRDVFKCNLRQVSWVIPTGQNSDHAGTNTGGGPSWVATVINTIGNSPCRNPDGSSYWDTTAIIVSWDDWGGFYDHEAPDFLPYPQGGYQYGFRVPLIFVSAYTPVAYINNKRQDFGSIVRFIEFNFGIEQGALTFADARSVTNFGSYYNLSQSPRIFHTIGTPKNAEFFLNDKSKPLPPDDD